MKHTKKEILDALKVIRDECAEANGWCAGCPFSRKVKYYDHDIHECAVTRVSPRSWNLVEEEPVTWRAFKTTQ